MAAVLLDSGPLGRLAHPGAEQNEEAREWLATLISAGIVVVLPEIIDYEHRRKMLHIGSAGSVRYLDELKENITYAPLNTQVMLRAARLWAEARKRGLPTAPQDRLDVDVILASQALDFAEDDGEVDHSHHGPPPSLPLRERPRLARDRTLTQESFSPGGKKSPRWWRNASLRRAWAVRSAGSAGVLLYFR